MNNLQDLLNKIKTATQDGQSAAIDAINAIKQARMLNKMTNSRLQPGTETTIEIDPDLAQPKTSSQIDTSNTIIDDPDNLLKSQSQQRSQDSISKGDLQNTSNQNNEGNKTNTNPTAQANDQTSLDKSQQGSQSGQASSSEMPQGQEDQEGQEGQGSMTSDQSNHQDDYDGKSEQQNSNSSSKSNKPERSKESHGNSPAAKPAPKLDPPQNEHQAPNKQSLEGRKITIGRILNLANAALNKASNFINEAISSISQISIDRIKKDIEDLQNLTDDEIAEMSIDKFNELMSRVLDNIDKISKVDYSNDLETRIKKINQELSDPELIKELSREDALNKQHAAQEVEASERAKNKYTKGHFKSLDQFNIKFYRAIKDQVDEIEDDVDTWSAINKHHSDDGIIAKGTHLEDVPNETIPSIDIYVDCSGSWELEDIAHGEQILHQILEFERRGEIITHIYYGTNNLHPTKEIALATRRGTHFWEEMIDNIKANKTKNVVILTDDDMDDQARTLGVHAVVDGVVYWIWRNGLRGENLVKNLRGRRDNDEFEFAGVNAW